MAAFLVPLLVYLLGMRHVWSGDTEPAAVLPISILRDGDFDLREFTVPGEPLPYWFREVRHRLVSTYPIVPGILNLPVHAVADAFGIDLLASKEPLSLVSAAWICALSVLFLYLALIRVSATPERALLFAFVYAFGTGVWSLASRALWQHGPSLLFLTAALALLFHGSVRSTAAAGLLLGLAVVTRPTNAVIALPLSAYVLAHRRSAFPGLVALGAIPVVAHAFYAWAYWGSPFSLGHANPIPQVANFGGNPLVGLPGLLVSPSRGLFIFSPVLLFGVLGAGEAWSRRRERPLFLYLAVGTALLVVPYSLWTTWWGGHAFGCRFLIEMLPGLVLLLALAWDAAVSRSTILRAAFLLALGWSVFTHFLGVATQPSDFNRRMDDDPRILWSVRESEIVLSTKKLLAHLRSMLRA